MTIEETKEKCSANTSSSHGSVDRHPQFGDIFIDKSVARVGLLHASAPRRSNLNAVVCECNLSVVTPS